MIDATLLLGDGACAKVAGSLFHNLTVLGKNEKACWSIRARDVVFVSCVILPRC